MDVFASFLLLFTAAGFEGGGLFFGGTKYEGTAPQVDIEHKVCACVRMYVCGCVCMCMCCCRVRARGTLFGGMEVEGSHSLAH